MPYGAHECLRPHRGVDLTGKLRDWLSPNLMIERTSIHVKAHTVFYSKGASGWANKSRFVLCILDKKDSVCNSQSRQQRIAIRIPPRTLDINDSSIDWRIVATGIFEIR